MSALGAVQVRMAAPSLEGTARLGDHCDRDRDRNPGHAQLSAQLALGMGVGADKRSDDHDEPVAPAQLSLGYMTLT